jgi:hypothetical protein
MLLRVDQPFSKVFEAALSRLKLQGPERFRFVWDGIRLHPNDTPATLQILGNKMEDDDIIYMLMEQTGG